MINRIQVQNKLLDYLNRRISLAQLVDWAERAMLDGDFEEQDVELLTQIVSRLGLADIREFGLSWDDSYEFLERLGYRVKVTAVPA